MRSQSTSRHAEAGIVLRVLEEFGDRRGLEPQIHLDPGGLGERLRHLNGPQAPRGGDMALLHARHGKEAFKIVGEAVTHARPDDLDGDLA